MVYCSTNNLPQRPAQLAVRKPWLDSLLTKLVGATGHFHLPLLLPHFQELGSYFPYAALQRADL
jgi:hypothetical protein